MRIAVASGKGGTGKTTVASSLVSVWPGPVTAVDLDVEAPNLHLFLDPEITGKETAFMEVPVLDEGRCSRCGHCSDICQFKAISVLGDVVMVFDEMCHGCGACIEICPERALSAGRRPLGEIEWGRSGEAAFLMGRLRISEAMSPPLMRAVKARLKALQSARETDVVIDAPPGVSCPAVNAVMDADAVLLVTEPTPFGLYDLRLARKAFEPMGKPMGVVINRAGIGDEGVHAFCRAEGLPILAQIPYDPAIATAYADGGLVSEVSPDLNALFSRLAEAACALCRPHGSVPKEAHANG
jgi:MinD superfamily P-loop ATPase